MKSLSTFKQEQNPKKKIDIKVINQLIDWFGIFHFWLIKLLSLKETVAVSET